MKNKALKSKKSVILSVIAFSILCLLRTGTAFCDDIQEKQSSNVPSSKGPLKKVLLLKPFLIFGYNLEEIFTYKNTPTDSFFTDLTKFHNWRIGLGLRIAPFVSMEIMYSSMARTYNFDHNLAPNQSQVFPHDTDPNDPKTKINMFGHMIQFTGTFYTPAIDIKFGTLEFATNIGIVGLFGLENRYNIENAPLLLTISSGPQFIAGFNVILGFPKFASIRVFTEVMTLGDNVLGIPVAMNYGLALNIYLL